MLVDHFNVLRDVWKTHHYELLVRAMVLGYHYDQKCYSQPKNNSELFAVIGTQHRRRWNYFCDCSSSVFLFTELFLPRQQQQLCMCA